MKEKTYNQHHRNTKLLILLVYSCSYQSLIILGISVMLVVSFFFHFWIYWCLTVSSFFFLLTNSCSIFLCTSFNLIFGFIKCLSHLSLNIFYIKDVVINFEFHLIRQVFFLKIYLFILLFVCAGSLLLCANFL